ncbi:YbhB/YbcL family Raf kinase inhibitor-like protein [Agaribacterium haliotis]|uniref:YbhB/YbcL family Raf kinase inhibitor-like protein n=1 Tax=Agaribacterium haliotis TaxID=2013869 RepID=UPI000BB559F3|nr:YbhB/YbcL family Raf kinase inhibitor-like protein [Agaribacterium haliotis]
MLNSNRLIVATSLSLLLSACAGDDNTASQTNASPEASPSVSASAKPSPSPQPSSQPSTQASSVPSPEASSSAQPSPAAFRLSSSDYKDGAVIPRSHACTARGGSNSSPEFSWQNPPPQTASFALIMDDEVSPCGAGVNACKHWAVFNIPAEISSLPLDFNPASMHGVVEGRAYNGAIGYAGPCPPFAHIYKSTIYALDKDMPLINATPNFSRREFEQSYESYILGQSTISASFTP